MAEKQARLLRCSKLSCYAEFNRMVNYMSRGTGDFGLQAYKMTKGNRAEYLFYTTLASLLGHVVHNENAEDQKKELREVYHWFCVNKPLISAKTKEEEQKPKLSLTERTSIEGRPHTAPAQAPPPLDLPPCPTSSDHTHSRYGFTTTYMKESIGALTPPPPMSTNSRTVSSVREVCAREGTSRQCVSVVEISPEQSPGGLYLYPNTLIQKAPIVAARMELQRELREEKAGALLSTGEGHNIPDIPHLSPPNTSHSTSVHVLDLNPESLPTTPVRTNRRPSAIHKSAASGFKCSRYRIGKGM